MIPIKELRRRAEELQAAVNLTREELENLDDSPESIRRKVALANELPELEKSLETAVQRLSLAEERIKNLTKQKEESEIAYARIRQSIEKETEALIKDLTPKVKMLANQAMARAREAYDIRESLRSELAEAIGASYYPAIDQPVAIRAGVVKQIREAIEAR